MKRSRFSEEQIIGILKEHEAGVSVADLCRKHGVSDASIYKWKAKFGGMEVSEAKRRLADPRRPVGVLVLNQVSDPISEGEMGSDAPPGVGERNPAGTGSPSRTPGEDHGRWLPRRVREPG